MSSQLTTGSIFAHRYRIERCLAQGGMGEVYEVVHLETERRRALKVMHAHVLVRDDSADLRERFMREAKVAAHVESEFIVDVFDAGVDEAMGQPFLVMELLRGEELGLRIKRLGRIPLEEAGVYLRQTALALDKTHKASIVHRDIKPGNIFITEREDGQPWIKVLDFGIAKLVAEGTAGAATQAFGTPVYMAPEQFDPRARITAAVDIYALGMVAYTMLTGRAYWATEAKAVGVFALAAVAALGPREPASVRAAARSIELPPGFDAWFARITALDPAQRFASATEAVRALGVGASRASFVTTLPVLPPPVLPPLSPPPFAQISSPSLSLVSVSPVSSASPARASLATTPISTTPISVIPSSTAPISGIPSVEASQAAAEELSPLSGGTMHPASFPTFPRALEPPRRDGKKVAFSTLLVGGALAAGVGIGLGSTALRSSGEALGDAGPAAIVGSAAPAAPSQQGLPEARSPADPGLAAAPSPPPAASASAAPSASSSAAAKSARPPVPRSPAPRKYTRD